MVVTHKHQLEETKAKCCVNNDGIALGRGLSIGNMEYVYDRLSRDYSTNGSKSLVMEQFLKNLHHSLSLCHGSKYSVVTG